MAAPSLATEVSGAGNYPARRFNLRERKILESVKTYVDALVAATNEVVEDLTPQLGGNLDVNGKSIVSIAAGDIAITPHTTGDVIIDGLKHPQADGVANSVMVSDGSAQLSLALIADANIDAAAAIASSKLAGIGQTADGAQAIPMMAVVDYDFATHGTTSPVDLGVEIPDNAIITEVIEEIITDFASTSGTTTVTATVNSQAIGAAITADGSNAAIASVLPSGTPIKTTAADEINLVLSVDDITAGAARYYVKYVQSV